MGIASIDGAGIEAITSLRFLPLSSSGLSLADMVSGSVHGRGGSRRTSSTGHSEGVTGAGAGGRVSSRGTSASEVQFELPRRTLGSRQPSLARRPEIEALAEGDEEVTSMDTPRVHAPGTKDGAGAIAGASSAWPGSGAAGVRAGLAPLSTSATTSASVGVRHPALGGKMGEDQMQLASPLSSETPRELGVVVGAGGVKAVASVLSMGGQGEWEHVFDAFEYVSLCAPDAARASGGCGRSVGGALLATCLGPHCSGVLCAPLVFHAVGWQVTHGVRCLALHTESSTDGVEALSEGQEMVSSTDTPT